MVDRFVLFFAEGTSFGDCTGFVFVEVIVNCGVSCEDLGGDPKVLAIKPGEHLGVVISPRFFEVSLF